MFKLEAGAEDKHLLLSHYISLFVIEQTICDYLILTEIPVAGR